MCGIAGISSKRDEDVVPLLRIMLEGIKHRGPNGVGVTVSSVVHRGQTIDDIGWDGLHGFSAMGHTRLAVVGGTYGQQPFVSNDGQLILLHNGEIYNYKSLRKRLENHYHFDTSTDSEVLVHLLADCYSDDLFKTVTILSLSLMGSMQ